LDYFFFYVHYQKLSGCDELVISSRVFAFSLQLRDNLESMVASEFYEVSSQNG